MNKCKDCKHFDKIMERCTYGRFHRKGDNVLVFPINYKTHNDKGQCPAFASRLLHKIVKWFK